MKKVAVLTDSNSGISQAEAKEMGIQVIPMPFYIDDELFFEDISLTQKEFYEKLTGDAQISTSMPAVGDVMDTWRSLLKDYESVVYIPMSSGLSSSCETAIMLAQEDEFEGRVFVVNNQRISVTQKQAVKDALAMVEMGFEAEEIRTYLEKTRLESSIYISVDTLKYLKKGGRITPAAAALGTLLRIRPVLQIQGEKLDSFAKCRTVKQAKSLMLDAVERDCTERFGAGDSREKVVIAGAYSGDRESALHWMEEIRQAWPNHTIDFDPLSLSVSCHIGPGACAITITKALPEEAEIRRILAEA